MSDLSYGQRKQLFHIVPQEPNHNECPWEKQYRVPFQGRPKSGFGIRGLLMMGDSAWDHHHPNDTR
jgi:hypothetical protein